MRRATLPAFKRTSSSRPAVRTWPTAVASFLLAPAHLASAQSALTQSQDQPAIVHIDTTPAHAINSFDPDAALGSTLDVLSHVGIDRTFTPHILADLFLPAGAPSVTAITPNSAWQPGTGLKTVPGATPRTKAATSPAAPTSRTKPVTSFPTRCRIAASPPAAIALLQART